MNRFDATVAVGCLLAFSTVTIGCGGGAPPRPSPAPMAKATATPVPARTPVPSPTPPPPSYTDVLKTFPRDHKVCRTVVYLQEVGTMSIMMLSVNPKGGDVFQRAASDPTIKCVGTQVTVMKDLTLEGKRYKRGARLTVDKTKNWIEVSGWQ